MDVAGDPVHEALKGSDVSFGKPEGNPYARSPRREVRFSNQGGIVAYLAMVVHHQSRSGLMCRDRKLDAFATHGAATLISPNLLPPNTPRRHLSRWIYLACLLHTVF